MKRLVSEADSLNKWAEKARFQVDDYLVWKYDGGKDSVLQVKKEDYANCNTSEPIKEYNDGITKMKLHLPGPFYFISGAKGHCEKVVVVVISPRRSRYSGISPTPSPAESYGSSSCCSNYHCHCFAKWPCGGGFESVVGYVCGFSHVKHPFNLIRIVETRDCHSEVILL